MYTISNDKLRLQDVSEILNKKLQLAEESRAAVVACRSYLDEKVLKSKGLIYGVNTGFGALYNTTISIEDLGKLQENLVLSHACGMGEEVPNEIVKIMILLKIKGLSQGFSGIAIETLNLLIAFYNADLLPVVYQQGSLGASGDLAPLAHMSLALIGKGEVYYAGRKMAASEALSICGLQAVQLKAKEGLALLNGTQFMSAYLCWNLIKGNSLMKWANTIGALSLEAYDGRIEPFNARLHEIRPHAGQKITAEIVSRILDGSEIIKSIKQHVQDPYSFRCIPQVHGASRDVFEYCQNVLEIEINSVTDNPTVFPDDDMVISGGNFHGQPLALSLDFLAIALAELGSISERRVYQLISGKRGLPPFLVAEAGLNSGFMIPQYTAASIVSQNRQLCSPASIDTIDSSNGQEDHVSMGANAATKCYRVVNNLETLLAIELFNAAQAFEFRRPLKTSPVLEELISNYRKKVSFVHEDRYLHPELVESVRFMKSYKLAI